MSGEPVTGFSPVPDCIRDDIDVLAAIVFGAVWRYGRQTSGTCTASVEKIAERAGLGLTATRVRLTKLAENGWIIAKERTGQPTVYRDAGRWVVTMVGQEADATPPRNGEVPHRETVGVASTPPRNGDLPHREAVTKILSKKQEQDIAADAASASPMTSIASAEAITVSPQPIPPSPPTEVDDRWSPARSAFALDLEGRAGAWRSKAGKPLHPYGQLTGVFGDYCNDDPDTVVVTWHRYVAAMKAQKMKDGRPVWSIIRKANVIEQAGRWLADGGATGPVVDLPPGHSIDPVTGRRSVNWRLAR